MPFTQTAKTYRCTQCNHEEQIKTNHFGFCWSNGHSNCCPKCPPHAKFPEFGGKTIWECKEDPPTNYSPFRPEGATA